jgi:hypothetical protein
LRDDGGGFLWRCRCRQEDKQWQRREHRGAGRGRHRSESLCTPDLPLAESHTHCTTASSKH